MLLRGILRLRKFGIFIGRCVVLRCKSKLFIGTSVKFDDYCFIDAMSTEGVRIGDNVNIGKYCRIEGSGSLYDLGTGITLESGVGVNSNCFFGCAGGIRIGENTIIGEMVTFHSENHNYSDSEVHIKFQGVTREGIYVGQGCWIGAKSTILDGVIIGNGCVIAGGSLVKRGEYLDNAIYGGVPAKFIKMKHL